MKDRVEKTGCGGDVGTFGTRPDRRGRRPRARSRAAASRGPDAPLSLEQALQEIARAAHQMGCDLKFVREADDAGIVAVVQAAEGERVLRRMTRAEAIRLGAAARAGRGSLFEGVA